MYRHRPLVSVGIKRKSVVAIHVSSRRFIRARPEQNPSGERFRKQERPSSSFKAPAGIFKTGFVLAPAPLNALGRSEHTSGWRKEMQLSHSPDQLLYRLRFAIKADNVDSSVFGAAAQRCGQNRWWDALRDVYALHRSHGPPMLSLQRNMYLAALFKCVKGEHGFGEVQLRRQQVLAVAQQIWAQVDCRDYSFLNAGLNAALRVCAASGDTHGLRWAKALWGVAAPQHKDSISYGSFALVLETCSRPAEVDELLVSLPGTGLWHPDSVDLSALINAAGERKDWRRAETLWSSLVREYGVKPNLIAFVARSKVHLLCGRIAKAASVIDDMVVNGLTLNAYAAQAQIQALLVVCHSSLAGTDFERLRHALRKGESAILAEGSLHQKKFLTQAKKVASLLATKPEDVTLKDVLLEWKARERSEMSSWEQRSAGSMYAT